MQKNKAIILMGIKHSGKSTQGRLLAEHLKCPFIDVDDAITKIFKKTPREIYSTSGAGGFMNAEEETCKKIAELCANKQIVISTGGGICDNAPALNYLRPLGDFIFINVSEETACARILKKAEQLSDGTWKNLPAYIANKNPANENEVRKIFHTFYVERTETYKKIADKTFFATDGSKEENFKKLVSEI